MHISDKSSATFHQNICKFVYIIFADVFWFCVSIFSVPLIFEIRSIKSIYFSNIPNNLIFGASQDNFFHNQIILYTFLHQK